MLSVFSELVALRPFFFITIDFIYVISNQWLCSTIQYNVAAKFCFYKINSYKPKYPAMHFGIVSRIFYTPSGKAILKLFRGGKVYAIVALSRKYAFFMEMSKNNLVSLCGLSD